MVSKTHLKLDIKHWLTCITNGTSVDSIDLVVISNDKSLNVIVGSVIFPIWNDADDGDDSWGDGVGDGVNRLNVVVVVIIAVVVCAVVDIVDFVVINEHAVVVWLLFSTRCNPIESEINYNYVISYQLFS